MGAHAQSGPTSAEDRKRILEMARNYALEYTQTLPDFICNEQVRRYREGMNPGTWDLRDTLTVRLSYYGHREDYKLLLLNNKPAPALYEQIGGSITEGEFGTLLRQVFEPDPGTTIQWLGWEMVRGKRVAAFRYAMTVDHARYAVNFILNDHRYSALTGRHGNLYVDPENGQILRVTSEADSFPPDFPVDKVVSVLDYESTAIGDRIYVLPRTADVQMSAGTYQTRNTIEFQSYHKFNADADVTFDVAPQTPAPATKKK
jgi:hypothetical protein